MKAGVCSHPAEGRSAGADSKAKWEPAKALRNGKKRGKKSQLTASLNEKKTFFI